MASQEITAAPLDNDKASMTRASDSDLIGNISFQAGHIFLSYSDLQLGFMMLTSASSSLHHPRSWLWATIVVVMMGLMPITAQAEPTQMLPIEAPACKSPSNCDRDPAHMQQFIASFYKWYLQAPLSDTDWHKEPGRSIIKGALTNRFFKNLQTTGDSINADPLIYSQDVLNSWPSNIRVQIIVVENDTAIIRVELGIPPDEIGKLKVILKKSRGSWLIDSVQDLVYRPATADK